MSNSFGKEYRLLNSQDFDYLREGSKRFNHPFFRVYYKPSKLNSEHSRIGISISKKVGKAHLRNNIKRHFREFFRCSQLKEKNHDLFMVISPHLFKKNKEDEAISILKEGFSSLEKYLVKKLPAGGC